MTQAPPASHGQTPPGDLPLAGLRVFELHAIGPVPFAGQVLRGLGADVTRLSPPRDAGLGLKMNPEFDLLNQGKTALSIDLKTADGADQLAQLLRDADVLLEGFRPGVLERLGLAPAVLGERHPRLVIGRLSGWGAVGPLAQRAGHDINYLALTGMLAAIGTVDRPIPPLNLVADFGGGAMHLLVGVLAKLVQRSITGRGGTVETSILAGSVGLSPMFYGLLAGNLWKIGRECNLLDGAAPFYRVYRTADDRFVAVGAIEAKFYAELLALTELAGVIDPRQQMASDTWPTTTAAFERAFATRTRDQWAQLAEQRDCCVAPVLDFLEAARHPHNAALGLYRSDPWVQPAQVIAFDPPAR